MYLGTEAHRMHEVHAFANLTVVVRKMSKYNCGVVRRYSMTLKALHVQGWI